MDRKQAADWMARYYQQPDPDHLVSVVRALVSAGSVKGQRIEVGPLGWIRQRFAKPGSMNGYAPVADQPLIAFLANVFAQNPGRLEPWLDDLQDLAECLRRSLWIERRHAHAA